MTRIMRFADDSGTVRTGVADGSGAVRAFAGAPRVADLMGLSSGELRSLVESTSEGPPVFDEKDVLALPPLDGLMELWAAGVTYERSREARVAESTEQSVYERVYDAERPELFFKAQPWRVVTEGEPIAVRDDSELNVPEPELGLVLNSTGETVGYVVADDVSSRSIEGENPLYLPQAKVYGGSAAVSPGIVPVWETPTPARSASGSSYAAAVPSPSRARPPPQPSTAIPTVWPGTSGTPSRSPTERSCAPAPGSFPRWTSRSAAGTPSRSPSRAWAY